MNTRSTIRWPFMVLLLAGVLSACDRDVRVNHLDDTTSAVVEAQDALPYYTEASFTPHWYASNAAVPADLHAIRSFELTDQRGRSITRDDFAGKIYVANFFFASCPGICPTTMRHMLRLQSELAAFDDVVMLSHSVTPETDSVAALQAYAKRMDVLSGKWYLATGSREQIYDLGKHYYFADEDQGDGTRRDSSAAGADVFLHTESFFLVDRDGYLRGVYNGMNAAAVTQLIADIQVLRGQLARTSGTRMLSESTR